MFESCCTHCEYKIGCNVYPSLRSELFSNRQFQLGDHLDEVDTLLDAIARLWMNQIRSNQHEFDEVDRGVALSALFDLMCSALYAHSVFPNYEQKGIYCSNSVIFPYTWMCPLCVSRRKPRLDCYLPDARKETKKNQIKYYPILELLAKPGARFIGDVGYKSIKSILRVLLAEQHTELQISTSGGRRGEFDFTLASNDILVFGEVKAKPLIAFPLVIRNIEAPEGTAEHSWVSPPTYSQKNTLSLFISASNYHLPLEYSPHEWWTLRSILAVLQDAGIVKTILAAWRQHLEVYRRWINEPDHLRWHRFGCGNFSGKENGIQTEYRVANTKELPGLDRTDDIKKGTSQLLLFTRFKFGCAKEALKGALVGNLYAETHDQAYLAHLARLQVRMPDADRYEWVFDMILGMSRNLFNSQTLRAIFQSDLLPLYHVQSNLGALSISAFGADNKDGGDNADVTE